MAKIWIKQIQNPLSHALACLAGDFYLLICVWASAGMSDIGEKSDKLEPARVADVRYRKEIGQAACGSVADVRYRREIGQAACVSVADVRYRREIGQSGASKDGGCPITLLYPTFFKKYSNTDRSSVNSGWKAVTKIWSFSAATIFPSMLASTRTPFPTERM